MRRRLYAIARCASLVLLILTVADWAYSNWNSETLVLVRNRRYYAIDNYKGEVSIWKGMLKTRASPAEGWFHVHWNAPGATKAWQFNVINPAGSEWFFAGFAMTDKRRIPSRTPLLDYEDVYNVQGVVVPSWFLALLFAVIPTRATWKYVRGRMRYGEGLCPQCGYDLRASTDRCPECGRPITAPAAGAPAAEAPAARAEAAA